MRSVSETGVRLGSAAAGGLGVVPGWSIGGLPVGLPPWWLVLAAGCWRWLGSAGDGVGTGQAELGGPALDGGPEPVARPKVAWSGGVGQGRGGDGGVAVQDLAGQPGHFP